MIRPENFTHLDGSKSPIGYIYLVTNLLNGKRYVGQTITTPQKRWKSHAYHAKRYKGKTSALPLAIQRHGIDSFSIVPLQICSHEKLNEYETNWIERLGTFPTEYNMTKGGEGSKGNKISEEQKKQISKVHKGKKISDEHRERCRITARERIVETITRKKISSRMSDYWDRWHSGQEKPRKQRKPYPPAFGENVRQIRLKEKLLFTRRFRIIGEIHKTYSNGKKYWWLNVQCETCSIVYLRSKKKHREYMLCKNCWRSKHD